MFALHTGSAFAVRLFDTVGTGGVTWLRLCWAAAILLLVSGRRLWAVVRAAPRRDLGAAVILGTVSAGMMVCYSEATARIDLGTATSLEFLGPLAVAVLALRRRAELVWIAAALAGVLCLTRPWSGAADLGGVAYGLGGAVCVALYIVLAQRVGGRFGALHGLALSMTVAAVLTTPLGAPAVVADPSPRALLGTLGIALLYPLLPFLVEMVALQRMSRTAYSTFSSLEPAVSLMMGMLIIAQTPGVLQALGMALVVLAGVGAARSDAAAARGPRADGTAADETAARAADPEGDGARACRVPTARRGPRRPWRRRGVRPPRYGSTGNAPRATSSTHTTIASDSTASRPISTKS
ncbi:EamA family transporter [Marinitenerispora sediminis]|uniref:EamA family transporter n=2 Tax=Marinitenerispora sediminis TaxID=1931232 RepID=A0A368T7Z8_9ACTN|nr:EamA family transporter [Marinitenerispora sediminis]RCV56551.1 EamA family transporter [Marinitenerispora sediminis]RCV60132.1 EamA family transporter [Marinitenerispora sediminis]RCV60377.1 EamA family transporter [Marinitenerispora sediminis]